MSIAITCSECGTIVIVPDSAAGASGKCLGCGGPLHVPRPKRGALRQTGGLAGAAVADYEKPGESGAPVGGKGPPAGRSAAAMRSPAPEEDEPISLADEQEDRRSGSGVTYSRVPAAAEPEDVELHACAACDVMCARDELVEHQGKQYCAACHAKMTAGRGQHLALDASKLSPAAALTATVKDATPTGSGESDDMELSDVCVGCQMVFSISEMTQIKGKWVCAKCVARLRAIKQRPGTGQAVQGAGGNAAANRGPATPPMAVAPTVGDLQAATGAPDAALAALQAMTGARPKE